MLTKLPNELLQCIAEYLNVHELYYWTLTAKRFYLSLDDTLYTKAVFLDRIELGWPFCLVVAILFDQFSTFKRLLEKTSADVVLQDISLSMFEPIEFSSLVFEESKSEYSLSNFLDPSIQPVHEEPLPFLEDFDKCGPSTTLLHLTCHLGRLEMARLLIRKGECPSLLDCELSTPLHIASSNNNLPLMELLVAAGADVSAMNRYRMSPLGYASANGNVAAVQLLLNAGADVKPKTDGTCSSLHLIAGTPENVKTEHLRLWQREIDPYRALMGTPLSWAARNDDMEMAKILLEHGADVTALDRYGETVLHGVQSFSMAKLLTSVNENLASVVNHVGITPIRNFLERLCDPPADERLCDPAASEELEAIILLLIEVGVSVMTINNSGSGSMGETVFKKLVHHGCDKAVKAILEICPGLAQQRGFGVGTPLLWAAPARSEGMVNCVKHLIEAGCEINAMVGCQKNALYLAAQGEKVHARTVVQLLLRAGIDISAQTLSQKTALHEALCCNNPEVALDLIEAGIDVSIGMKPLFPKSWKKDPEWGTTALHCAAHAGYFDVVKRLVECHADISAKDNMNDTALHIAVRSGVKRYRSVEGYVNMMALILLGDQSVSVSDVNGETSLHDLSTGGYMGIVKFLIASGADAAEVNRKKHTALKIAFHKSQRRLPNAALNHSEEIRRQEGSTPQMSIQRWLGMMDEKSSAIEDLGDLSWLYNTG